MAATVTERFTSRVLSDGVSHERIYSIEGTADEAEALAALKAEAPTAANSLLRGECGVEPEDVDSNNPAGSLWLGRVPYTATGESASSGESSQIPIGGIIIQGTTGGGSHTIKVGLDRTYASATAPSGETAPAFKGAINVGGGVVHGVAVGLPVLDFTVTKVFDAAEVPTVLDIYRLGWTTNAAAVTFTDTESGISITMDAGEGLFTGIDFGRARADGGAEFVYHFSFSPNATDIEVGPDITVSSKTGHQYLWVYFEDAEDSGSNRLVQQPVAAYVETVYYAGDWDGLDINPAEA